MNKYKLTLIGMAIAVVVFFSAIIFDVDLFEMVIMSFESVERFEIDEVIIPIVIFGIFTFFDQIRRRRNHKIELEKIRIYKAMMSSAHHILDNLLNDMQSFKVIAENTPEFDPEVLSLYEKTIEDTSVQIDALGNITSIDEASIHASVATKMNSQPSTQQSAAANAEKPRR